MRSFKHLWFANLAVLIGAAILSLLSVGIAAAEMRTINATGEYRMGDNDTRADAKRLALLDAKRVALEQAGTYIESVTQVKNFELSNEEIHAYTVGLVEVGEQATRDIMEGGTHIVRVDVTVKIDTYDVVRQIDTLRKDKILRAELQKIRAEKDYLQQQVNAQTQELAVPKSRADVESSIKQRQQVMIRLEVEDLLARAWVALNVWGSREGEAVALNLAKEALARDPDCPEAHRILGQVFKRQRKYEAAIQSYKTALRSQPNSADAHLNLGRAFFEVGKLADAMNEYEAVLRLQPPRGVAQNIDLGVAHNGIGEVLAKRGDITGAREEFRTSLRFWPDNADPYSNLGEALFKLGDLTGAIAESRVAVRLHPSASIYRFRLALLLSKAGDHDGALEESRVAARLNPEDPVVHYGLGYWLYEAGKREEAAREFRQYIRLAPDTPDHREFIQKARIWLRNIEK